MRRGQTTTPHSIKGWSPSVHSPSLPHPRYGRMLFRKLTFLFSLWLITTNSFSQSQVFAEVLTAPHIGDLRKKIKAFEDQTGLNIAFRINDKDLDALKGLSGHLLRLFQEISVDEQSIKSILGEFQVLNNPTNNGSIHYTTLISTDLATCRYTPTYCATIDSLYNAGLSKTAAGWQEAVEEVPELLDEFYPQVVYDYKQHYLTVTNCQDDFDADAYTQHVRNTAANRSLHWRDDIKSISLALTTDYGLLSINGCAGANQSTLAGIQLSVEPKQFQGHYIIDLNNCFNSCTRQDLEVSSRMLFKKTGISLLFLCKSLTYYLPVDSLAMFADSACHAVISSGQNEQIISGLWLQMIDGGSSSGVLLVRQSGQWISAAEINRAAQSSGSQYKSTAIYKYNSLFKEVPKPLTICYQTAKVNGLLTTVYLNVAESVKGREELFVHVFKIDRSFSELSELQERLRLLENSLQEEGGIMVAPTEAINLLQNTIKQKYARALRYPDMIESGVHFKANYLQDKALVEAAALRHLKQKYPLLFKNNRIDQLIGNAGLPEQVEEGTCNNSETSDAIGNTLGIASLLLAPTGLDIVPDALSVVYYAATDQTLDCVLAGASFLVPGNLNTIKHAITASAKALEEVQHGNYLFKEGAQLYAGFTDFHFLTGTFGVPVKEVDENLLVLAAANEGAIKELMAVNTTNSKLFSHISQKLPADKRKSCLEKLLQDADFRAKVLQDPDEVVRWAQVVVKVRGVLKSDFLLSVPEFSLYPTLAEKSWEYFCNEEWARLEMLFVKHNLNGGWPPYEGFIDYIITKLEVGKIIDRYGGEIKNGKFTDKGKFVAENGSSFESRALPDNYRSAPYKKYKVLKEIPNVKIGKAIPWYGKSGKAIQYKFSVDIDFLIENKFLEEIL